MAATATATAAAAASVLRNVASFCIAYHSPDEETVFQLKAGFPRSIGRPTCASEIFRSMDGVSMFYFLYVDS